MDLHPQEKTMTQIRTIFDADFAKLSVSRGYNTNCQWYTNANTEHWWNNRNIKRNDIFIKMATLQAAANKATKKS
jgi:hypothetical protein